MTDRLSQTGHLMKWLDTVGESHLELVTKAEPMVKQLLDSLTTLGSMAQVILPVVQQFSQEVHGSEVLKSAGWVPHYTMPFSSIARHDEDAHSVREQILDFYAENWQDILSKIQSRLSDYRVDATAKATLNEALEAHSTGLYRCVCRVLFPEIERLLRLYTSEENSNNRGSRAMIEAFTGEEAGKNFGDFIPNGIYEAVLFEHFIQVLRQEDSGTVEKTVFGLYTSVLTKEALERVEGDPVPNRHAAMHGLVDYSDPQHSLNMIFIADYIFQIMSSFSESATAVNTDSKGGPG